MKFKFFVILGIIMVSSVLNAQMKLNGAGATFPYVIYSKWFDVYHQKTGIQFNYQSIGSGGGIKQVIEGTVDFGASDAPMTDQQLKEAQSKRGTEILHIPTVMGAVVVTYNLPQTGKGLKLTPEVLTDIFLGKVKKWNDPRITSLNKGKNLPDKAIFVAHRSDGSGTTNIFTGYLSKVSNEWKNKVGQGTSVNWPVGLGGKGNEGVAGLVKQTQGAIGYVELAYAVQNGLPYAALKNKAGNFVEPTFASVSQAAAGFIKNMPADLRVEITNAGGKDSYPISAFTWLLVYKNMKDKGKAKAISDFLRWAVTEGQKFAPGLYYAPLPKEVVKLDEKKISNITVK
ncbi:MAG: phosphate ABC transporter substrate-binding protein PstS [Ignavibacteria bacterium]|jgi:phosphate transport system substrate-binding protein|nr:phosphate ABC transporter substrate-binding protein PstS [Ignavibacteria bacterium]MCU7504217.1 phosphate ABC transporter substrate-binding protein PstS [Ignavibacteria bacterium]MCU7516062.1 phosphate ABC transporter substrate-binding protein PstS [Ignavibacteria bacterium]